VYIISDDSTFRRFEGGCKLLRNSFAAYIWKYTYVGLKDIARHRGRCWDVSDIVIFWNRLDISISADLWL
jgi:hypothetical protein